MGEVETERDKDRKRERDRDIERDKETERDRDGDKETKRQRQRETDRHRQTDRQTERRVVRPLTSSLQKCVSSRSVGAETAERAHRSGIRALYDTGLATALRGRDIKQYIYPSTDANVSFS